MPLFRGTFFRKKRNYGYQFGAELWLPFESSGYYFKQKSIKILHYITGPDCLLISS